MTSGKIVIMQKFFIRSKTNNGEFAKQYFIVSKSDIYEPALLVRKLILSGDHALYKEVELLRIYKGKGLYEMKFSIKISTLKMVIETLFKND